MNQPDNTIVYDMTKTETEQYRCNATDTLEKMMPNIRAYAARLNKWATIAVITTHTGTKCREVSLI